jgi:hypothetical protein
VRDGGRGEVLDFGQERWRVGAGEVRGGQKPTLPNKPNNR